MPHTPGPWETRRSTIYGAHGHPICTLHGAYTATYEEFEANHAVIAAAPQMLTALKAAWFAIDPDTHPDQNRMVRDAIDAAEGKTNG